MITKKVFLAVSVIILFLMSACSSSDDPPPPQPASNTLCVKNETRFDLKAGTRAIDDKIIINGKQHTATVNKNGGSWCVPGGVPNGEYKVQVVLNSANFDQSRTVNLNGGHTFSFVVQDSNFLCVKNNTVHDFKSGQGANDDKLSVDGRDYFVTINKNGGLWCTPVGTGSIGLRITFGATGSWISSQILFVGKAATRTTELK